MSETTETSVWPDEAREAVAKTVRDHASPPASGGTATGARCDCSCGERIWGTTRAVAERRTEQHLSDAVLAALAPHVGAMLDRARAEALREVAAVEALAEDFEGEVDWSSGRGGYGDNAAWESAARRLRAALAGESDA